MYYKFQYKIATKKGQCALKSNNNYLQLKYNKNN